MKTGATVFILGSLVLVIHLPSLLTSPKTLGVPRKLPLVFTSPKTLGVPRKLPQVFTSPKTLVIPRKLPLVFTSPKTLAIPRKLPLVFTSPKTLGVPRKLPLVFTSPKTLGVPRKLPLVFTSPKTLAVPEKLQHAVGRVIVNATACTVTCGLGYKEETVCEVGPDGVRRKCKSQRMECLTNWICGMLHFTIVHGEQFELSCLSAEILEVGQEAFRFTWKIARGIISTNDEVFKSFRADSYFLRFKPAYESDSGTYRCDVQLLKNLRFVKRLYFGLRVLPPKLVNLNFNQSLTEDQKLVDEGWEVSLDNQSKPHFPKWQKKVASAVGIGIASGVVGGVLVSIAVLSVLRSVSGDDDDISL